MKKWARLTMIAVAVGGAAYYAWDVVKRPEAPVVTAVSKPAVSALREGELPSPPLVAPQRYPMAADLSPAESAALPALEASDGAFGEALKKIVGGKALLAYFYPDMMIRRVVATVDNLPRRRIPASMMPIKPVGGAFQVTHAASGLSVDAANAERYLPYVAVMNKLDVRVAVDLYVRLYPLFQEAYLDLGYPKGHFNDRLVEALDDLLAAPEPSPPVALIQPKVLYQFADADLEARSAGQKIMMRMGGDNARQVKVVLKAIRAEIVRRSAGK